MDLRESRTSRGVRHPWERARAEFLTTLLERHSRLSSTSVLDVGSGDAWLATELLRRLPPNARIDCVDACYDPDVVRALGLPARVATHTALPEGAFDLVMALDVAEHVADDAGLLAELRARVAVGGSLLFTVPAWPALFSDHDRALGHHRRYRAETARALLARARFRVVEDGYFFHSLIVPRIASVAAESMRRERPLLPEPDTAWRFGARSSAIVTRLLVAEQKLTHAFAARGLSIPGLSYYALAVPT